MSIGRIVVDPGNSSNLLLAASINTGSLVTRDTVPTGSGVSTQNEGIWRSTDGGATWTHVLTGGPGTDVVYDPADPTHQTVYAALAGVPRTPNFTPSGIWKSTNDGLSFTAQRRPYAAVRSTRVAPVPVSCRARVSHSSHCAWEASPICAMSGVTRSSRLR